MIAHLVCLVRGHEWLMVADTAATPGSSLLYRHSVYACTRCGRRRRTIEGAHP